MVSEKEIEQLALQLQAQGPDEYPFGYFMFLARRKLNEKEAERGGLEGPVQREEG